MYNIGQKVNRQVWYCTLFVKILVKLRKYLGFSFNKLFVKFPEYLLQTCHLYVHSTVGVRVAFFLQNLNVS